MKTKPNKEIYKLWWEYLRRSNRYKAYCDWIAGRGRRKDLLAIEHDIRAGKFKNIITTHAHFGDIHSGTFEDWWEGPYALEIKVSYNPARSRQQEERSIALSTHIGSYMDSCINSYMSRFKRKPSLEQFRDHFSSWLEQKDQHPGMLFLVIDTISHDKQITQSTFKRLLDQETSKSKRGMQRTRYWYPSTKVHLSSLRKYLDIYDLREKKVSWKAIAEHLSVAKISSWESIKRQLQEQHEKARKIIEFAESGVFPGPYDSTRDRRQAKKAR